MTTDKKTGYPSIDKPWLKYFSEEAIKAPLPNCSAYEYMYANNKDYSDNVAIDYFGRKITFAELFDNIDNIAISFHPELTEDTLIHEYFIEEVLTSLNH